MTDNEIIKALECCCASGVDTCSDCPLHHQFGCIDKVKKNILDLINRQKAEIERLNIRNKALAHIIKNYDWKFAKAKTEAIKEFAERLKQIKTNLETLRMPLLNMDIDNLVKEMTE